MNKKVLVNGIGAAALLAAAVMPATMYAGAF